MLKFSSLFLRPASRALLALSLVALCGCGSRADQTDVRGGPIAAKPSAPAFTTALDTYIARDEPAYKWEKVSEKQIGKNLVTTLKVTSQTWQGIEWTHRVEIAWPEKNDYPGWAVLYLSTTDGVLESILMQSLAPKVGAVTIHVTGMPNQPLYGKREDALIAHTFEQYLATNDETWPLLLPMTKGAIKAMDAVQEYTAQQQKPLNHFVVAGASKRGWTTWLVGAADTKNRVGGIVPLVYNNLNLAKQMPHQLASWGAYSPSIDDYTKSGLQAKLNTPRGMKLSGIVDPYTYRSRLTMPKLIVNATNDPYWTLDALNIYWDDLSGPKNVYNAPNVGHSMDGELGNVFGTMAAWFQRVAGGKATPEIKTWMTPGTMNSRASGAQKFYVQKTTDMKAARLWVARSANRDFRSAKWQAVPMEIVRGANSDQYVVEVASAKDTGKYTAAFVQVDFTDALPLSLSSVPRIWNASDLPDASKINSAECPFCRQKTTVVPVVYGLLSKENGQKVQKGEAVHVGTDVIGQESAHWYCRYCERGWGSEVGAMHGVKPQ